MIDPLIDILTGLLGIVLIVSLIALAKPFGWIRTRWIAGGLIVGSIVMMNVLNAIPPFRPGYIPPDAWAKRVAVCRAAGRLRGCAQSNSEVKDAAAQVAQAAKVRAEAAASSATQTAEDAASSASDPDAAAVVPQGPTPPASPPVKASFLATQSELLATFAPCDESLDRAAKARGQYAGYNAAVAAKDACWRTMTALNDVRFGDPLPQDLRDGLNAAVDCFGGAYAGRSNMMSQGATIMNGDMRPSAVAEFRTETSETASQTADCRLKYLAAAASHGLADAAKPVALGSRGR